MMHQRQEGAETGMQDPKDEGTRILQSHGNYLPDHTTLYPVSLTSSVIPLWNAHISHKNSADSQQSASYCLCTNTCSYKRKYTAHFCQLLYTFVSPVYFNYSVNSSKSIHRKVSPCFSGCALAQAVSHRPLTTEAQVQSEATPCGVCGRQSNNKTGFSPSTLAFPSL